MTSRSTTTFSVASALALALAAPVQAQPQAETESQHGSARSQPAMPAEEEEAYGEDNGDIVVTGVRPGTVIGDIPPENTLGPRDIRATGAADMTELLEALAPQIGSARGRGGGRPVLLLNGQRISGFRELRDIPTEAIDRVDILPEEVALKYGFRADQRVVNIVLRQRFRSTAVRMDGKAATEGGYSGGIAEMTQLRINRNGRINVNLRAEGNTALTEAERDIVPQDPAAPDESEARTLTGSRRLLRGSTTLNKTILGNVSSTVNTELEHSEGRSLIGLSDFALEPLARTTDSDSAHFGLSLNGNKDKWRWSLTGNGDVAQNITYTDREDETRSDRTRSLNTSGDLNLVANGPLFTVPAGAAGLTVKLGASALSLDSTRRRSEVVSSNELGRTQGSASASVDLPISRRNRDFDALGNLTLNANAEVERLSDFGTLTTIGAGANWSPVDRLNLIASWTREEGAPSVSQLGDPILETPGTRVFDFTTGETVLVNAITGGNPALLADRRDVMKIGGNWKPFEETDLRLRGEYVRSSLDRPVSSFPGPSETLEAAFPDRFVRDSSGQLVSVDFRPVNYDHARRDTLRWGFDFTKPLRSARPSQATIDRLRAMRGQAQGQSQPPQPQAQEGAAPPRPQDRAATPTGPEGGPAAAGGGGFGFRGGRGFFGGGRQGGRLQFSLTHTVNLVDRVTIRPGVPEIDYLHGDAVNQFGGRPRHQVEAQAGWSNNGLGGRLSANWRSGTSVDSEEGGGLRFSPVATFDLRLFANLGERLELVSRHPWLRGASVRFEVDNLFDSKPRVSDGTGEVPFSYQPDLLDPIGRTVSISLRKLFLPRPQFVRRGAGQRQP